MNILKITLSYAPSLVGFKEYVVTYEVNVVNETIHFKSSGFMSIDRLMEVNELVSDSPLSLSAFICCTEMNQSNARLLLFQHLIARIERMQKEVSDIRNAFNHFMLKQLLPS